MLRRAIRLLALRAKVRRPGTGYRAGTLALPRQTWRSRPAWQSVAQTAARQDNLPMNVFYWLMGALIVGTFVPSVLYLALFAATGRDDFARRARALWNASRVLTLLAVNILIWGHVIVALWQIWFR
jgi:hypothetical protein